MDAVKEPSQPTNGATISKLNIVAVATLVFSASFTATAFALTFWQQCIIRMVYREFTERITYILYKHTYVYMHIDTSS